MSLEPHPAAGWGFSFAAVYCHVEGDFLERIRVKSGPITAAAHRQSFLDPVAESPRLVLDGNQHVELDQAGSLLRVGAAVVLRHPALVADGLVAVGGLVGGKVQFQGAVAGDVKTGAPAHAVHLHYRRDELVGGHALHAVVITLLVEDGLEPVRVRPLEDCQAHVVGSPKNIGAS